MITKIFKAFLDSEKTGGFILILCTIISILLANSELRIIYNKLWEYKILVHPIKFWINDGLMSIFFLLIGLEIRREIYQGELSNVKNALLPISAALGGMVIPALIYYVFNRNTIYQGGMAIPTATDIAFSLGILSLFGNRIPNTLKIFLAALAIVDDLGAIIIIALFYAKGFTILYFGFALLILGLLFLLKTLKVKSLPLYVILGMISWYCVLKSGIHPTIAGVLLAFTIPFERNNENDLAGKLERIIHIPVAYFVLPLFALANTCILIPSDWFIRLSSSNNTGIILGLVLGKPIGIISFSFLSVALGYCALPSDVKIKQFFGVAMLAGIGFTMSIFITLLAFNDAALITQSKIAILLASLLSVIGSIIFLTSDTKKT